MGFLTKLKIFLKSTKLFKNWYVYPLVYFKLTKKQHVIFETKTGLNIKIRVNSTDLMALTHVWMIQEYSNSGFDINDSDIVIDIGAHIGLFALFASQFCKQGKIFCFEPIKENYELLVENINSNKIKNIIPFNFAVSKESDSVKIFLNDDYSGHSMFLETNNFVIVKSKSLLDIFSENNIQECNFLKLDCEGAEYDIINSLPSDFLNKIKKSVIEYHLADTHPQLLEQLIKKLRKCSFIVNTRPLFSDIGFLFANKK